jgi:tetratricopeptide (TPR) repeat protein
MANALGQAQRAADYAKQSLALAVAVGDLSVEGQARLQWGMALARLGERQTARAQFEAAQTCAENDVALQSMAFIESGRMHLDMGAWNQAEADLDRGLALARECEVWDSMALALLRLSDAAWQQDAPDRAKRYAEESLAIYRKLGDRQGIAKALDNVGLAALLRGDHEQATRCFTEYLAYAQERGDQRTTGQALSNLGHTAYAQGDHRQAAYYFQEALRLSKSRGYRHLEAEALATLGMIYATMGDSAAAQTYLHQGLRESTAFGLVPIALNALVGVAWLQVQAGNQMNAAELLGLARNHPALERATRRDTVEPILDELGQVLSPPQLDAALARGEELNLDSTIASLLDESKLSQATY